MRVNKGLLNYEAGSIREYLITNGTGSYCSGTINGNLSRQYHALLVKSFNEPVDRYVVAHKIEEYVNNAPIFTRKQINAAKTNIVSGYKQINFFEKNPFPKWQFCIDNQFLEKEIFMPYLKDMTVLKYRALSEGINFSANIFTNFRDMHEYSKPIDHSYTVTQKEDYIEILQNDKRLYVYSNKPLEIFDNSTLEQFSFEGDIIHEKIQENIAYEIEITERGAQKLDSSEHTVTLQADMAKDEWVYVVFSMTKLENFSEKMIETLYLEEFQRVDALQNPFDNSFEKDLALAADQFIVRRASTKSHSILAGFPWFSDWGRDTMIALCGLTMVTKRHSEAKSILQTFLKYLDKGMFPNRFPDAPNDAIEYNTIDAALWFFYASKKYVEYTGDTAFLKESLLPAMESIVAWHIKGTRFGIKMDCDGLISGGEKDTNLTWMDARYKGWSVTPRYGKAVEINALWYNAVSTLCEVLDQFNQDTSSYKAILTKIEESFETTFYNSNKKCLYDYVAEDTKNDDCRLNQIFAVSLPYCALSKPVQKEVVDYVYKNLYTPLGLRSLSRDNKAYSGLYYGTLFQRDSVYHQGTVWGWCIGAFVDAHYKVYQDKQELERMLVGFKEHCYSDGVIGSIAEIFDGDAPFETRGCFAQAWSVSEVLRVIQEYGLVV